jgi:hypothetical protein
MEMTSLPQETSDSRQGPTNKGLRTHSFLVPSGNRIQSLELMEKWLTSNTVCSHCKQGQLYVIKEVDIEGLSSSIVWKCSNCENQSLAPTSSKVKFTGKKGEQPKAAVNLTSVGGIMTGGELSKHLKVFYKLWISLV